MLSRNDEKKTWMPTITSVNARIERRCSLSEPKPRSIHSTTITAAIATPASATPPPSSRPCSSLKRRRMRSNHGSRSFMK